MTCIPPGEVIELPDGRLKQEYMHDFYNYSGIHRTPYLVSTPVRRVEDVTIVAGMDGGATTRSSRPSPATCASP